ncbi:MAG TPA: DUF1801 domain-containing protein [Kofleriaceae bacterium]|nr:DUF1801 domain-containing protein [Kofleriaceae bacterium]
MPKKPAKKPATKPATKSVAKKKPAVTKVASRKPAAKAKAPPEAKAAPKAKAPPETKAASKAKAAPKAKAEAARAPAPALAAAPAPAPKMAPRADYGQPVDSFFRKQPPHLRPVTDALRALVEEAAPDATSSIKWGMPFYSIGDGQAGMMCAIGAHKSHVNLILSGPPGTFVDPEGLLAGDGKTGRHLKVSTVDELPSDHVRRWLRVAADRARAGA